jgi:hypothetical protein
MRTGLKTATKPVLNRRLYKNLTLFFKYFLENVKTNLRKSRKIFLQKKLLDKLRLAYKA